jgi:DNA-directed RNA polymerase subunit N
MRPVRCMTCGKLLGDRWEEFDRRLKEGEDPKKILDEMGIKRYCCRATMLTSVDLTEELAKYK